MKKASLLTTLSLLLFTIGYAQLGPEVTSWVINTTGATGYNSIPSNCQLVQYSADSVYVSATCIPGYDIGPWNGNPNVAENQNFVFCIPRHPQPNTGTAVATPLGHNGIWTNGVSIFNASDAMTYNNLGYWHRNAYFFEGPGFDTCLGHPQQNGEYHHHVNPRCLYDDLDSTHHSPILGYAFDGFPIYGAYAYSDTNGTGPIRRMRTSFQFRKITTRDTLPNGTVLSSADYGPAISSSYPLGAFLEDYEFVAGSGDLDIHNGRICVTPEYPNGIYAYFITIDSLRNPVYPYTMGPTYFGTPYSGDVGPTSGHITVAGNVTTYTPSGTGVAAVQQQLDFKIFPNPTSNVMFIFVNPIFSNNFSLYITNVSGNVVMKQDDLHPTITASVDVSNLAAGTYFVKVFNNDYSVIKKVTIAK